MKEKHINNIVFINGKVSCRNSYERKCAHEKAIQMNATHKSIIDYTKYYVNETIVDWQIDCCWDCGNVQVKISGTPYSYVVINEGNESIIIGNKSMIPPCKIINISTSGMKGKIKIAKRCFVKGNYHVTNVYLLLKEYFRVNRFPFELIDIIIGFIKKSLLKVIL